MSLSAVKVDFCEIWDLPRSTKLNKDSHNIVKTQSALKCVRELYLKYIVIYIHAHSKHIIVGRFHRNTFRLLVWKVKPKQKWFYIQYHWYPLGVLESPGSNRFILNCEILRVGGKSQLIMVSIAKFNHPKTWYGGLSEII